jgi:hypothetical protein
MSALSGIHTIVHYVLGPEGSSLQRLDNLIPKEMEQFPGHNIAVPIK